MSSAGRVFEAKLAPVSGEHVHIGQRLRCARKLFGLTQKEVAERLCIGQSALARIEQRPDILISTLRDYLGALGATLRIDARFEGTRTLVGDLVESRIQFDEIEEDQLVLPIIGDAPFPQKRDVVFSIKPEYSEQIVRGQKTVELRRRFPTKVPNGTIALIYETSPIRALTGIARIGTIKRCEIEEIWSLYSKRACITRPDFDAYFLGVDVGFAIELRQARPLHRSFGLSELRERFNFEPPQSFLYASPQMREALSHERAEISHRY